jgi:hypothetical protein
MFISCHPVTDSNIVASSASVFTTLLASEHLTTNEALDLSAYNALAQTAQKKPPPTVLLLLHHVATTDRIQNSAFKLLHCSMLWICCLAMGMFAEPFASNGCLYWFHSSSLEQICHIMLHGQRWHYAGRGIHAYDTWKLKISNQI